MWGGGKWGFFTPKPSFPDLGVFGPCKGQTDSQNSQGKQKNIRPKPQNHKEFILPSPEKPRSSFGGKGLRKSQTPRNGRCFPWTSSCPKEGNSRNCSESVSQVFQEFFLNFIQDFPATLPCNAKLLQTDLNYFRIGSNLFTELQIQTLIILELSYGITDTDLALSIL